MVSANEFDIANLGSNLHDLRRSFYLQIFDNSYGIPILEDIANGIFSDCSWLLGLFLNCCRPFMRALWADQQAIFGIDEFGCALRAGWQLKRHDEFFTICECCIVVARISGLLDIDLLPVN